MDTASPLPLMIVISLTLFFGVFFGRMARSIRLPGLMGFMVLGILLGPSVSNLIDDQILHELGFIPELTLGLVAITIGLELNFIALKQSGRSLILIVLGESLLTFGLVTGVLWLITGYFPLSLIFGAIAVTTAPAGNVAVIQENNARGPLTRSLLAVVGFDDGAAIIIFGFALALTKFLLAREQGLSDTPLLYAFIAPLVEIGLSMLIGAGLGVMVGILARQLGKSRDVFILSVASVFLIAGIASIAPISLVLTAMIMGMALTNTQSRETVEHIGVSITEISPFMFLLFFGLAGAHLKLSVLPQLGLLGIGYILARSGGKICGSYLGARMSGADPIIRRYLGIGILSQAGLAIGLTLIAAHELTPLGPEAATLARTVAVTITATCLFFEVIGPILTKYVLSRAGEVYPRRL